MAEVDDIEAIKRLKARYFRLMDTKDWDGFASLFVADVVIDVSEEGGGVVRSVAEFLPYLRANIDAAVTVHHGHMPEIEITSSTTATGIWAMEDHLWWPDDGSPVRRLHGYGHYHETYAKTADGWLIATLKLTRLHREFEFAEPPNLG